MGDFVNDVIEVGTLGIVDDPMGIDAAQNASAQATQQATSGQMAGIEELRRQFGITQENLAPFIGLGTQAIGGLQQGSTVGGLDQRLAEIFGSDAFSALKDERTRAVEGGLAAGGLMRSGAAVEEFANIPTELGFALEQLLNTRQGNLVNIGQNTAVGAGSLGNQASQGIAGGLTNIGNIQAQGTIGSQQAAAAGLQNLLNLAGTLGTAAMMPGSPFNKAPGFSDPLLKDNIIPLDKVGPLTMYKWDWSEDAKKTIAGKFPTVGFLTTEVKEHFPEYVSDFGGFDMIDYPSLIDRLESLDG